MRLFKNHRCKNEKGFLVMTGTRRRDNSWEDFEEAFAVSEREWNEQRPRSFRGNTAISVTERG